MKRPAAAMKADDTTKRPAIPKDRTPVHYLGGRIYDDPARLVVRCYVQSADKVDKKFSYKVSSRKDAFEKAFEAIEEN